MPEFNFIFLSLDPAALRLHFPGGGKEENIRMEGILLISQNHFQKAANVFFFTGMTKYTQDFFCLFLEDKENRVAVKLLLPLLVQEIFNNIFKNIKRKI